MNQFSDRDFEDLLIATLETQAAHATPTGALSRSIPKLVGDQRKRRIWHDLLDVIDLITIPVRPNVLYPAGAAAIVLIAAVALVLLLNTDDTQDLAPASGTVREELDTPPSSALSPMPVIPEGGGGWEPAATMPVPRIGFSVALLDDQTVLVYGGAEPSGLTLNTYLYDPNDDAWTQSGDMRQVVPGESIGVYVENGGILLIATRNQLFDPGSGEWSRGVSISGGSDGLVLRDNRLLTFTDVAAIVDPLTGFRESLGAAPFAQLGGPGHAAQFDGDHVLASQAHGSSGGGLAMLNLETGGWVEAAPLPDGNTHAHLMALGDGRVMVTGGSAGGEESDSVHIYDSASNSWSESAPLPWQGEANPVGLLPDGRAVWVSGITMESTAGGLSLAVYDPDRDSWLKLPNVPGGVIPVILADGRLLAISGGSPNGAIAPETSIIAVPGAE